MITAAGSAKKNQDLSRASDIKRPPTKKRMEI